MAATAGYPEYVMTLIPGRMPLLTPCVYPEFRDRTHRNLTNINRLFERARADLSRGIRRSSAAGDHFTPPPATLLSLAARVEPTAAWVAYSGNDPKANTAKPMQIALNSVSKTFDGKLALAPTTVEVAPRQTLVLIGPSGCGKSTLLRVVLGLIEPDAGTILFDGIALTEKTRLELRRRIGYVIQDGGLFPHLTAARNIAIVARHLGWDNQRIATRLSELCDLARIEPDLLDRYPAQLSGGQRQRVGLMRALMLDPKALLMDEPFGALDPIVRSALQEDMKAIFQRLHKTVLFVTHDMGEAGYLGDEIVLMRDGHVVQSGAARDLLERPAEPFVTEFIRAQRPLWTESQEVAR